jgi:alcohol dehydrogenase class IV
MSWDGIHAFSCPTRVEFGPGAAALLPERMRELGAERVLVVSDPGVAGAGLVERIVNTLVEAGLAVTAYAETEPNPTIENVLDALALYRSNDCDALVGLGGGSAMDCAKGVGILAAGGSTLQDHMGIGNVGAALPPLACVPTTCGTGSEVTFNAVISDPETHRKLPFVDPKLAPRVALVDPAMVVTAPASVIAATGADALSHAIESYINLKADPLLDALNIGAIRLIGRHLRAAVSERDPEAVAHMALASTMAGIAFNMNANAIVHAASTPVTAKHGVPHGVANAIFMAPGLDFCLPACAERLAEIGAALGADVRGLPAEEAGRVAIDAIRQLLADAGLPRSLREWGVARADVDIPALVADALTSRNIAINPRPITPTDLEELYEVVLR